MNCHFSQGQEVEYSELPCSDLNILDMLNTMSIVKRSLHSVLKMVF